MGPVAFLLSKACEISGYIKIRSNKKEFVRWMDAENFKKFNQMSVPVSTHSKKAGGPNSVNVVITKARTLVSQEFRH